MPIIVNNKDNLEGYGFYEVMPSEGFFRIKQKIGLTQEQLEEFNPRLIEEGLKPGMILKFPESLSAYYEAVFEPVDLKSQITNLSAKNLVVMLPFNLELIDTDSIVKSKNRIKKNQLLSAVLDFHSGVLIAIDSAKQIGISTNLRVYDTQKRNSDRIKTLLIDEDFSNADAIIGPVTQGNFDLVSERVLDEEIPVLSPLLNFNTRFPNSIQTLVPKQLLSERIINFVKRDTSKVTLTLISDQAHKVVSDSLKTQFTDALQLFSLLDKDENDAYFFDELGIDEEDIEEDIKKARENNKKVAIRDVQQREFEELMRVVDKSLPSQILDGDEISTQIDELSSKIANIRTEIEKISSENIVAERHNTRISIIDEQTNEMESQLEGIVAALGKVEEKSAHLEILKKAFSTNGLLAYKIENLVKDLEQLTNEYLSELSDGRFSLEFVVTNDKLNVEITDNAKVVDILALSSGELARVNTATLLAIRKLMSSISSSRINTLFLDEIISVLDDEGKEKIVEILLNEDLNTYLVSHGWTHPLVAKIEVIKEENISHLE